MQEVFAASAEETAKYIVLRAQCGNGTAMRRCVERTPLALEPPPVRCAADVQKALDMVIEAFGRGEITTREFPCLLGAVDRMTRVAERIEAMSERERERYDARRVHGVHPDMIPKPTGEPDRLDGIMAAIERGEDPFPDDPAKSAYVRNGERLYPPVNLGADAAEEMPTVEPGTPTGEGLYSPVNSEHAAEEGPSEAYRASSDAVSEAAAVSDTAESDRLYSPVNFENDSVPEPPPSGAADAAPPSLERRIVEAASLYSPVNSGASGDRAPAWDKRPALPDGSRLVAALPTADGGRAPLYVNPG